ncbi:hypothetical protein KXW03_004225, partial [Aspergillus fumigatus]
SGIPSSIPRLSTVSGSLTRALLAGQQWRAPESVKREIALAATVIEVSINPAVPPVIMENASGVEVYADQLKPGSSGCLD